MIVPKYWYNEPEGLTDLLNDNIGVNDTQFMMSVWTMYDNARINRANLDGMHKIHVRIYILGHLQNHWLWEQN